ncbi:hypothetical protein N8516_06685 [Candidatus Thioglobus sp.]|nr:hypothetical protein [Candidatus Thioglobus sp.]
MSSNRRVILGDMSAIRASGIDFFEDNYFWPVSDNEFNEFSKNFHKKYVNLLLDITNDDLFNIALIEMSFIEKLVQILHFNYIKEYSNKHQVELLCGEDSISFREPDWNQIGSFYSNSFFPFGKFKRTLRRVIKNIIFNKHLSLIPYLKGFFAKNSAISIGSMDVFKKEFIKKKKIFVNYYDWIDLINTQKVNNNSQLDVKFFEDAIINKFFNSIESDNSLFLHNIDLSEIKLAWKQRFLDILNLYGKIHINEKAKMLLVSDMAKPHAKLITIAYQSIGSDVYCFHHGNDACYSNQEVTHQSTVSHANFFITPSDGIKNIYENFYSKLPIEKRCGTKYISINTNFYSDLYADYNSKDKSEVNKIMLVGFPFDPSRYDIENNLFFYKILLLEYQLIKTLKDEGYYVIYKAHPERLSEVQGLFNDLVNEYLSEPFELVWRSADLILFTYTSTTTFGFALTTSLPIILIDSATDNRDRKERKQMEGRVNIVDAKVDAKMKIVFNKEDLISKIQNNSYSFQYVDRILGHKKL